MDPCEDGVYPYDPKYAGTKDYDNSRYNSLTDSSGGCDSTVHKSTDSIGKPHNVNSLHTCINDSGISGKQGKKLTSEEQQQYTKDGTCRKSIKDTDHVTFFHSLFVSVAKITADKTGTCSVECKHNVKNKCICIDRCSVSGYHDCVKRIDSCLHKKVGNGKDGILDTGRDTKHQYRPAGFFIKVQI